MAMKGAGYYSRATIGAKHVMDNAAGMVLGAVDRMRLPDNTTPFRATDMGQPMVERRLICGAEFWATSARNVLQSRSK